MIYCKGCKWLDWCWCEHPSCREDNIVFGPSPMSAHEARAESGPCGPDAKLFEQWRKKKEVEGIGWWVLIPTSMVVIMLTLTTLVWLGWVQ